MIQIDKSWSLFLDRDGVINVERNNDYVYNPSQFKFDTDVLETLKICNSLFARILVVTNQRGIGRGLMSHQNLSDVHNYMLEKIASQKGRIDKIYYAPDINDDAVNRKPNIGMALQAKEDFPTINFSKSIMVGNNLSDMEFGKRMNMKTVFVNTTQEQSDAHEFIDYSIPDLSYLPTILQLTSH